jgi:hypothetical protein
VTPGSPDPLFRPLRGNGDNGGGYINYRSGGEAAVEALQQQMREMLGEEGFARWQRSMDLGENPRPLTDAERAVLRHAAAPLLADLAASGMPVPDIREEAHNEPGLPSASGWLQEPDGAGQAIGVLLDRSPAQQVAELAEQIQDWATDQQQDANRPRYWPACPKHPDAPHRLTPEVRDDRAVWSCWESRQVIWPIGELAT